VSADFSGTCFSGIWIADLSLSRLRGPQPRAITIQIEHSDPELRQEILVTRRDGSQDRIVFQCATNGEPGKSLLNGKTIRGTAGWQRDELVIESWVQFGAREMHFCDHWSLSADGSTLSMEHRNDDLAGQLTLLRKTE